MKRFKNIVVYGLIGIGAGNILNIFFSLIYGEYSPGVPIFLNKFSSVNIAVVIQYTIYFILGNFQGVASRIFKKVDEENYKILYVKHYLLIILPLIFAGYYLKWFEDIKTLILMILFSSLIYVVIAVVVYLSIRNDIRKINSKLEEYK